MQIIGLVNTPVLSGDTSGAIAAGNNDTENFGDVLSKVSREQSEVQSPVEHRDPIESPVNEDVESIETIDDSEKELDTAEQIADISAILAQLPKDEVMKWMHLVESSPEYYAQIQNYLVSSGLVPSDEVSNMPIDQVLGKMLFSLSKLEEVPEGMKDLIKQLKDSLQGIKGANADLLSSKYTQTHHLFPPSMSKRGDGSEITLTTTNKDVQTNMALVSLTKNKVVITESPETLINAVQSTGVNQFNNVINQAPTAVTHRNVLMADVPEIINQMINGGMLKVNPAEASARIQLFPQNLGQMTIHLQVIDNQVSATILVSSQDAANALENQLNTLRSQFTSAGLEVARIDVVNSTHNTSNSNSTLNQSFSGNNPFNTNADLLKGGSDGQRQHSGDTSADVILPEDAKIEENKSSNNSTFEILV